MAHERPEDEQRISEKFHNSGLPKELTFFTYDEVAIIMKVKVGTVRRWVSNGEIQEVVRQGKRSLVTLAELQRFVAARKINTREHYAGGKK